MEQIFDYFGAVDGTGNPELTAALANTVFVQFTTDSEGVTTITNNDTAKIRVVTDVEPLSALAQLGLARIAYE